MTAMLPGAFAKAPIETRFEDTLVSAHRVASARRTSSRRCSAAMPDHAPDVRLRLDRLTALRGGQGPHRRRRGEPLLPLTRRRPLPLRRSARTTVPLPPLPPRSCPGRGYQRIIHLVCSLARRGRVSLSPAPHFLPCSRPHAYHPFPGRSSLLFTGVWVSPFLSFGRFWVGAFWCYSVL